MRKALMTAVALLIAAPASAEDWDFILVNDSGKDIKSVEIAPAGSGTWVANRVDEGTEFKTLKPGGRTTVHFDKNDQCKYDVKATFADDTNTVWTAINVCDNAYVTVRYKNGAPVFAAN